nr:MAG: ORF1 [Torque teno midi virus]
MPFWWRRRKKFWSGRRRWRYRPYKNRKRRFRRRRYRRPAGRRRRRRKTRKVRRKKQKITVQQWQPDRIVKCKIRGLGLLVAGTEGRQFQCFTDDIKEYPPPKNPGGGGFGIQVFNLKYLYEQWVARKNIWTKSNDYTDLARYTGTKIRFFRHPDTDFVVSYNRMPPFKLEKETYLGCHPVNLLLAKHHKVILSRKSKPQGKNSVTIHIKPPKLMQTNWYMQQDLCKEDLFEIRAAACNLGYSYFGPNTQSQLVTFYALNTNFFQKHNWAQDHSPHMYIPYLQYPATKNVKYVYRDKSGTDKTYEMPFTYDYYQSINKETGFFNWRVLTAKEVKTNDTPLTHEVPMTTARYNPMLDNGDKTYVWVVSVVSNTNWQTPIDSNLIVTGYPLWMAFYGLWNYILRTKSPDYLQQAMFVCKCPAIQLISKTKQDIFPILDLSFIKGQMPWDELLTETQIKLWYPTAYKQQQIINTFVESGPYIPKYSNLPSSSWNLTYLYTSYFKWGGPQLTDQPVQDPCPKKEYDITDHLQGNIQISHPLKQKYKQLLRAWDVRRGLITKTAIKRMYENLSTDASLLSDESETPKKKTKTSYQIKLPQEETQEIQKALLSLCEENTCQDQDLHNLIQHQQQQQQQLKKDLINILIDLKNTQRILQHRTGVN